MRSCAVLTKCICGRRPRRRSWLIPGTGIWPRTAGQKGCLVHGEYNYHNILVLQAESGQEPGREFGRREQPRIAVTGFEKFKQGIQAEDLYYFLRKVMEKQGWKVRLGDNMLNAYSAIRPLSEEEMQYLCLRFVYPEKFWKTADSYYRSNKVLLPAKSLEKLETAIRQTEEKKTVFRGDIFFSFINSCCIIESLRIGGTENGISRKL